MAILRALWSIARGVYLVGKAVVQGGLFMFKWAVAHPLGAALVGVGLLLSSLWLRAQPWIGANVLANVTGTMGTVLVSFGIGAWVGGLTAGPVGKVIGAAAGGYQWLRRAINLEGAIQFLPMPWRSLFTAALIL